MNTTNTPDRDEVIKKVRKLMEELPITTGESELLESALILLEQDKEDGKDRERINGLRVLCGYIEAGEGESISIGQDDATKDWLLHRGKEWWYATSFRGVIDSAMAATTEKGEG